MEPWFWFTIIEALSKTSTKLLSKIVGNDSVLLVATCYATLVVGLIQVAVSYFLFLRPKGESLWRLKKAKSLAERNKMITGSVLFGTGAFISTVLGFAVFLYGGHVGVNTFIITLGIIPGALIDWLVFKHRFTGRQISGIAIGVLSGYFVLGQPSLSDLAAMPLWVWLSFGMMASVTLNQMVTQWNKDVDPMVKNFYGGLTTAMLSSAGIIFLGLGELSAVITWKLTLLSAAIGAIVVLMWSMNVMAYQKGAYIAIKKLVLNGAYLILVALLGDWLFGDTLSAGQYFGFFLFFGSFSLMDKTTWEFVWRGGFVKARRAKAGA